MLIFRMVLKSKKVLVIFAGGHAFSGDGSYKEQGKIQATQDDLVQHIIYGVAQELSLNIEIDLSYLGASLSGANEKPQDWNKIGQVIADSYGVFDGFVVLHGQDTIPWAGSQLAYSLQNLGKPVIFADGSKATQQRGFVKSQQTLVIATQLAAFSNIPEVAVLSSNDQLLKCVDALQYDASDHCSFISRNNRVLAHIGADIQREPTNIKPIPDEPFRFLPVDTSILVNVYETQLSFPMGVVAGEEVSGIVIQVAGAGDVPVGNSGIRETLIELKERRIPVVAITKDTHGHVDFSRVPAGEELINHNVISGGSMTVMAAVTKLRAALSMQVPYEDLEALMQKDMFGETKSLLPIIEVPNERIWLQPSQPA